MTAAAISAAASSGSPKGAGPGTANRSAASSSSRNKELLRIQLIILLIQLSVPLYYHSSASSAIDLVAIADKIGHGPPSHPNDNAGSGATQPGSKSIGRSNVIDPSQIVGTFNNVPISYVSPSADSASAQPLHSTAHCIGETFHDKSWVHRSCEYRNMCFDTEEKEFVLFRSPTEASLAEAMDKHNMVEKGLLTLSSALNTSVSLGGINMKWTWKPTEAMALEWKPIVRNEELREGYYLLPEETVILPFHSMAAVNVGHLMWDDLLPIYTILSMFEMLSDRLLPVRYVLKRRPRALWATCNLRDQTLAECKAFFKKFLPLMGVDPETMKSTEDSVLNITDGSQPKSRYICSPHGAAGLGMLTDHGLKTHGWDKPDYEYSHNTGRGPVFNGLRNFMMRNLGLDPTVAVATNPPYIITISLSSSKDPERRHSFRKQISALEDAFGGLETDEVKIRAVDFKSYPIIEQVKMAAESAVLIGACGGGAVTNMFMAKGSAMILYYPDRPSGKGHHYPARLDWDYFNNAGYARMNWLPISAMNSQEDLDLLVKLVRNEIETISHH